MSIVRPFSTWPSSTASTKRINHAVQIQYYVHAQDDDPEGSVSVFAVNVWRKDSEPYQWRHIPRHLERIFMIIAWIQWVIASCYFTNKMSAPLLGLYVLYMENLLDRLWDAVDSGSVKTWERTVGSHWVQVQKYGNGFHSLAYVEKALSIGLMKKEDLGMAVRNWDEEAEGIEKLGFPGANLYKLVGGKLDMVTNGLADILHEFMEHLKEEENGECQA
jgi:hypothetical protein